MIGRQAIDEIIAVYAKHGWVLRRVLLSAGSVEMLGRSIGGVEVTVADLDAAWFSRPPKLGIVAWEVRYLGPSQYALVEHVDEDSPEFENVLTAIELRLKDAVAAKDRA